MSRTTHRSLVAVALASAALLTAGCGFVSSPEQKVSETTDNYLRSLATGEHDTACRQLTVRAKASLAEPCLDAMEGIAGRVGSDALTAAADAGIEMTVEGGRAAVVIPELDGAQLTLLRSGPEWRIDAGYALR